MTSETLGTTCGFDPNGVAIDDYLARTYHPDPKKRKQVLSELCPCQTMEDFDAVWKRIVELTHDESAIVRDQALHNLGDGSPRHLQEVVMECAERLYNDPRPQGQEEGQEDVHLVSDHRQVERPVKVPKRTSFPSCIQFSSTERSAKSPSLVVL